MIGLIAPLVAQAAVPVFAPPLGRPIVYTVSETRAQGGKTQRFAIDRRVTFRVAGDGFVAEVETLSVVGDGGRAGQMFEAMARSTLGKRVVLTLDTAGKVVDVADLDTVWGAQLAAITTVLSSKDPARAKALAPLLAPLQALPRAAQVARVGEMVKSLIADAPVAAVASRAITLPARAHDGSTATLAGTERVAPASDGTLILEQNAGGQVLGATMTVTQRRRTDPRTGIVTETISTSTIEIDGKALVVTRSTLVRP